MFHCQGAVMVYVEKPHMTAYPNL